MGLSQYRICVITTGIFTINKVYDVNYNRPQFFLHIYTYWLLISGFATLSMYIEQIYRFL